MCCNWSREPSALGGGDFGCDCEAGAGVSSADLRLAKHSALCGWRMSRRAGRGPHVCFVGAGPFCRAFGDVSEVWAGAVGWSGRALLGEKETCACKAALQPQNKWLSQSPFARRVTSTGSAPDWLKTGTRCPRISPLPRALLTFLVLWLALTAVMWGGVSCSEASWGDPGLNRLWRDFCLLTLP